MGRLSGIFFNSAGLQTGYNSLRKSKNDFRRVLARFQDENFAANKKLLIDLTELAQEKGCTISQLSLAWLLAQGEDIVPIPGTKKIKYLEENLGAINVKLSSEETNQLNQLFSTEAIKGEKYPINLNFEN